MSTLISLKNIQKKYILGEQVVFALKDISLEINKGDYIALMGPSGSGKSTLMNVLGCLDTPTKGTYRLRDEEVSRLSDDELSEEEEYNEEDNDFINDDIVDEQSDDDSEYGDALEELDMDENDYTTDDSEYDEECEGESD